MPPVSIPASGSPIILHTSRRTELLWAVVFLLFGVLMIVSLFAGILGPLPPGHGTEHVLYAAGWGTFALVIVVMAYGFICHGIGAAWRLIDRRPAAVFSGDGAALHPSFHRTPLSWSDIVALGVRTEASGAVLTLRTHHRYWSLENCFAGRATAFAGRAFVLSDDQVAALRRAAPAEPG